MRWILRIGPNNEICIDEKGRLAKDNFIEAANEIDALIEAKRRVKKIHFYLVTNKKAISFDMINMIKE